MNLEVVEEEPYVLDDSEISSEELAEDASLDREGRFLPGRPIHDHPGGWHEIGEEVGVVVVVVVVVVVIGGVDDACDGAVCFDVNGGAIHVVLWCALWWGMVLFFAHTRLLTVREKS